MGFFFKKPEGRTQLWNNVKWPNKHLIGVPKGEERKIKESSEKIKVEIFQNLLDNKPKNQGGQKTLIIVKVSLP